MVSEVEGQLLHEPLDERRPITVEQGNSAERPFLRHTIGKGLPLRPEELTPQRVVTLLGGANHLAAQGCQVVLQLAERRFCRALESRINSRNGTR